MPRVRMLAGALLCVAGVAVRGLDGAGNEDRPGCVGIRLREERLAGREFARGEVGRRLLQVEVGVEIAEQRRQDEVELGAWNTAPSV